MTDIVERLRVWRIHATHKLHADLGTAADEIESLRQQLAECQARERKPQSAAVVCLLTTELDTLKKQWQREALLEAVEIARNEYEAGDVLVELQSRFKELEGRLCIRFCVG